MTASIVFVLTILSALSSVMAQTQVCSLCNTGDVMSSSTSMIPAGTISFITEELSCVRVELLAQTAQWTAAQCTEAQASAAPTICGCMGENTNSTVPDTNTTIPDTNNTIVEDLVPITGQLIITLESVQGEMPADVEATYNGILSAFFGIFLTDGEGEVVKNVSATTVNQTLVDAATSRLRDLQTTTATALAPLDTWVEVTGLVVNGSQLMLGTNFTDELIFIATNHSDKLIEATGLADSATNQSYFANVEAVNATSTEPAEEPAPAPAPKSTKKDEAPTVQTVGILVGILAALVGAIFIASQIQGKQMLEEEEERRIAKEKLEKAKSLKQSKVAASEEALEDE